MAAEVATFKIWFRDHKFKTVTYEPKEPPLLDSVLVKLAQQRKLQDYVAYDLNWKRIDSLIISLDKLIDKEIYYMPPDFNPDIEGEKHSKDKAPAAVTGGNNSGGNLATSSSTSASSSTLSTPVSRARKPSQRSPRGGPRPGERLESSESSLRSYNYNASLLPSSNSPGFTRQKSKKGNSSSSGSSSNTGSGSVSISTSGSSPAKRRANDKNKHERTDSSDEKLQRFFKLVHEGNTTAIAELFKSAGGPGGPNGGGGLPFDIDTPSDFKSRTALHLACVDGNKQLVKLLLRNGASMNQTDSSEWSPLHCAAVYGRFDVVVLLVEKGHDTNVRNVDENTVLHYLVRNKMSPQLLKALEVLIKAGASVDHYNKNFETPLHTTVTHGGDLEVCKFLLRNNASLHIKNKLGLTALEQAQQKGRKDIAEVLEAASKGEDIDIDIRQKFLTSQQTSPRSNNIRSNLPTVSIPVPKSASEPVPFHLSNKFPDNKEDKKLSSSLQGNSNRGAGVSASVGLEASEAHNSSDALDATIEDLIPLHFTQVLEKEFAKLREIIVPVKEENAELRAKVQVVLDTNSRLVERLANMEQILTSLQKDDND